MTDLQGSVGIVQLERLDTFIDERKQWANWYREQLSDVQWLRLPQEPVDGRHGWQSFVTYVDPDLAPCPRNEIMEKLQECGISTRPGTHAVHMLTHYRKQFGIHADDYPMARDCDANTMAIPLHNRMSKEDYEYVVHTLKNLLCAV